jgi:hypothetical protein
MFLPDVLTRYDILASTSSALNVFLQVSNVTDTMKIACDFLSVESLAASRLLIKEFRTQRLARSWPEDVLQLDTSIWYAWNSLYHLHAIAPSPNYALDNPGNPTTRPNSDLPRMSTPMMNDHRIDGLGANDQDPTRELQSEEEKGRTRRQQKRRARRQRQAVSERPYMVGHDCRCLFCPRQFNKSGLIHHM